MNKRAFFKYLFSLLIFGMNGVVASYISLNSYEIVFLRTLIGSALLISLFLISKQKFHFKEQKRDLLFIALSGVTMGASWMFLFEAYQQIGVSISTLLYYCGPVIVMVFSPVLFKERLTLAKIIGFCVVLVGILLINGKAAINGANSWGLICGGLSAVMYFFMVTLNKQAKVIKGLENSVIQLAASFLTLAIFIGFKQRFIIHIPAGGWPAILMLGILNTGIACYFYFSSLTDLPAQTVAIFGYLDLLSAVMFASLFLKETMTLAQIIGAACIIGGAMTGELIKKKSTDPLLQLQNPK